MLICPLFVLSVLTALFALFALAWRFEPTMVVVLFGVLRFVLAMLIKKHFIPMERSEILTTQLIEKNGIKTRKKGMLPFYRKNMTPPFH
jgi:membrane protein implicated in regulation of membrane protease activity